MKKINENVIKDKEVTMEEIPMHELEPKAFQNALRLYEGLNLGTSAERDTIINKHTAFWAQKNKAVAEV